MHSKDRKKIIEADSYFEEVSARTTLTVIYKI